MFFIGSAPGVLRSLLSALALTLTIVAGVLMTFAVSKILSCTLLKGLPSSFTLELPPYRRPQICKVIVRSVFNRTLFVLGRAMSAAAPAGLMIWLMANITAGGESLLRHCAGFIDPFARLMGLDGVILMAFIFGLPANEIVFPIIIMTYLSEGTISELGSLSAVRTLLAENGWTFVTAVNMIIFSLMHWPCSTTLMTVKKETGSLKWTLLSALIPTLCGFTACFLFTNTVKIFSYCSEVA